MNIHIIAIGGSIMHNLAIALKKNGHNVTGSDDDIHEPSLSRLKENGLLPKELGWFPEKINPTIDLIILGMHARKDNPELIKAAEFNLKTVSYPEFIYLNSLNKKRIVVGGSHGKTTITSMILHALKYNNIASDYLVGAQIQGFDTMVNITETNKYLVAEGDEYLASPVDMRPKFLIYKPHIAIISGIAWDHINVFPTYESYKNAFRDFIFSIEPNGILIYNSTDNEVKDIVQKNHRKDLNYIPYSIPKYSINNEKISVNNDGVLYPLEIIGKHNLLNMEAAKSVCNQINISNEQFYKSISNFKGAAKRLETWIKDNDIIVYRDFAHAPSKVKATIDAVKELYQEKTIIAVLELHTYSSLNPEFLKEYKDSMIKAGHKIVYYDSHTLQIKKMQEIPSENITTAFNDSSIRVSTNKKGLLEILQSIDIKNKVLLLMSSGTFSNLTQQELTSLIR